MTDFTTNKALYNYIGTLGLRVVRRSDGPVAMLALPDRLVMIDATIRISARGTSLDVSAYVALEPLGPAIRHILGHGGRYDHMSPLCSDHGFSLRRLDTLTDDHITTLLARITDWAEQQDVESAFAYCLEPHDHPRAVDHLAALALVGDVDRLRAYEQGFHDGTPSPFFPYVTIAHVMRARELAEART
jgi:hypothetical protein